MVNIEMVNGYMVVDCPSGASVYRGVDREPWAVLDEHYYSHRLPADLREHYEHIHSAKSRGAWWPFCSAIDMAEDMLLYSQKQGESCEIIAVRSAYLEGLSGVPREASCRLCPIGFDVASVGEWSLLKTIEESPHTGTSDHIRSLLNPYGLLMNPAHVHLVERSYRHLAEQGFVEPIAEPSGVLPVEAIQVFIVERSGEHFIDRGAHRGLVWPSNIS